MRTAGIEAFIALTERYLQRLDRRANRSKLLALQRQDMAECAERWWAMGERRPYRDIDGKVHMLGHNPPKRERPRCGARTRAGGTCKAPALPEKERCRMHGGLSTGPRTAEGKARAVAAVKAYWERWRAERELTEDARAAILTAMRCESRVAQPEAPRSGVAPIGGEQRRI